MINDTNSRHLSCGTYVHSEHAVSMVTELSKFNFDTSELLVIYCYHGNPHSSTTVHATLPLAM